MWRVASAETRRDTVVRIDNHRPASMILRLLRISSSGSSDLDAGAAAGNGHHVRERQRADATATVSASDVQGLCQEIR
jgi:hypothetical protein